MIGLIELQERKIRIDKRLMAFKKEYPTKKIIGWTMSDNGDMTIETDDYYYGYGSNGGLSMFNKSFISKVPELVREAAMKYYKDRGDQYAIR